MPYPPTTATPVLTAGKPEGTAIAILGGDNRERELVTGLLDAGYLVLCCGRELSSDETAAGARPAPPETALRSRVVIAPMAGVAADGKVWSRDPHPGLTLTPAMLERLPDGAVWFSGKLQGQYSQAIRDRAVEFIDLSEHDVLAVLNAVPSAEGAIMMAMQGSPFCLHSAESLVLGFGRTGEALAMMLRGLGSRVTVVARAAKARARALAMGYGAAGFDDLAGIARRARFCFNTVPALVLNAGVLAEADRDMLVVDIASRPGGTDFAAAEQLGIKAVLAPGLPGLVAPRTAGQYLTQVILETLKERRI